MTEKNTAAELPETMRALVVGHGSTWKLVERDVPRPGAGEVLVRVHAAASNNGDIPMIDGADPAAGGSGEEAVAGFEYAGEIAATGDGVSNWSIGDAVMGSMPSAYADYVLVDARFPMPRPATITPVEAATLPVGLLTEHGALVAANFVKGRSVLVTGASSGVGLVGVQVAKAVGASTVIGTTRRESMRQVLTDLGVNEVIVTDGDDLAERVLALTDDGVDVVLEHLGSPAFAQSVEATAQEGHLVPVSRAAGSESNINLDRVGQRRLTIRGVSFGFTRLQEMTDVVAGLLPEVIPAVERGEIRAVVDSTYDVTEHEKVVERLRSGENVGKVVMTFVD